MKASILDVGVLSSLKPVEIMNYLRMSGWSRAKETSVKCAVWTKDDAFEIALPLERDLGDFVLRMSDALKTIEAVEGRSQMEILNDLSTFSADIVRFRITEATDSDGTIPLEEGVHVVQHARDLVMAGACAAVERRPLFQTRKPSQAIEYLKKVRMGQTERGSYVVTVLSRVAPVLSVGEGGKLFECEEPYERQVTATISRAVAAARRATGSAAASGNFEDFRRSVTDGVSANLCDAIRGLTSGGETDRGVEISFSWSRSRPVERAELPQRISFPPDSMPVIEEAARLFRETAARDEFELCGPVVKLERAEGAETGRATILGYIDERPRKVLLELDDHDYSLAIQAHKGQQTVYCLGSLVRTGRNFALRNPRGLEIEVDS